MSRVGVGGSRYDTQRKPYPAIGGEGKRRQLLVNENLSIAVENMEVGGDIPILALMDRNIVIKGEPGFVESKQQRLFILRNKVKVEAVSQFLHPFRLQTAQEHRIW